MRTGIYSVVAALVAGMAFARPSVQVTSVAQDASSRAVTVSYALTDGPAVITFDVSTNGVSLAGEELWNVTGDVNCHVSAASGSFVWTPSLPADVAADAGLAISVTAWSPDDTPDYMVVDLSETSPRRIAYYPAKGQIPGGDLDPRYRTGALLLRKCPASGVVFTMGADADYGWTWAANNETPHAATLGNSYYIGVFEITQTQWALAMAGSTVKANCLIEGAMRPMECVTYAHARESPSNAVEKAYYWPADPNPDSLCGRLRKLSRCAQFPDGVDFDLPSEAQWEYACRAGNGQHYWGNGQPILGSTTDDNLPGRYRANQAEPTQFTDSVVAHFGPTNGTAVCGSYEPNAWGIYDMHGNVWEWCLDWYAENITGLNGAVNASGSYLADGVTLGANRVRRGGCWYNNSGDCRSANRLSRSPTNQISWMGIRVCCRGGHK